MKNLLIILLSFFIFVGCGPKSEVVVPKDSVVKPKDPIVQPIPVIIEPTPQEPIIEEVVIEDDNLNRIAIIYPSRIVGKYAKSTISTISAFLIYNDQPFQIQTFDTYDENHDNIIRELS